jgi:hypothetical protein
MQVARQLHTCMYQADKQVSKVMPHRLQPGVGEAFVAAVIFGPLARTGRDGTVLSLCAVAFAAVAGAAAAGPAGAAAAALAIVVAIFTTMSAWEQVQHCVVDRRRSTCAALLAADTQSCKFGHLPEAQTSPAPLVARYAPVTQYTVIDHSMKWPCITDHPRFFAHAMRWARTGHTCSHGWCSRLLLGRAALGGRQRAWPCMAFAGSAGSHCFCRHCSCQLLRHSCFRGGWPESDAALGEGRSELWALVVCCIHQTTVCIASA